MDDKQTKFEQDLKIFFPDISKLNAYGKLDEQIWSLVDCLCDFYEKKAFGKIEIFYQEGKIQYIMHTIRKDKKRLTTSVR